MLEKKSDWNKENSKRNFFWMIHNLTIGWYLCFHKHWHTNLNAYLNIYSCESFFWRGIEQSALVIEMMIQKNLKALERMEVLIASHMKVFHGSKCNSYTCTAQNAKVTSTRIVYEKSVMKWKVFRGVFRAHSNIYNEVFLRK